LVAQALTLVLGASASVVVAQECPGGCDDGNACTVDTCDPMLGCVNTAAPAPNCLVASRARLSIWNSTDDTRDQINWKWARGQGFTQGSVADPTTTSAYSFCIYAGAAQGLVARATLPPGTGWKSLGTKGYGFKGTSPNGLTFSGLKSGATTQASAIVKGKGVLLPDPSMPLAEPVTVQLIKHDSPLCLQAIFDETDISESTDSRFKAKRDLLLPWPEGTIPPNSRCNKDGDDGSIAEQVGAQMRRSGTEWASTCLSQHGASGPECEVAYPGDSSNVSVPNEVPSLICPNEAICDLQLGRVEWHAEDKFIRRCRLDEWALVWGWIQQRSAVPPPDCTVDAFSPRLWGVYPCYEEHFVLPVIRDQLTKLREYVSPNPPMTSECEGAIMTRMWWRLASDWIRHGNYKCPDGYLDPAVREACYSHTILTKIDQATWNAWCEDFADRLRPVYEGVRAASGKPY
jgi:hypothetical protein